MKSEEVPIYNVIGGIKTIENIVNRFYFYMDTLPEAKGIRLQHKPDLSEANEKLKMFLSGWLGGPQLFIEKYGHPRLRARHFPFKIGMSERDQWLFCMYKALDDIDMDNQAREDIKKSISRLADHMRNQVDEEPF